MVSKHPEKYAQGLWLCKGSREKLRQNWEDLKNLWEKVKTLTEGTYSKKKQSQLWKALAEAASWEQDFLALLLYMTKQEHLFLLPATMEAWKKLDGSFCETLTLITAYEVSSDEKQSLEKKVHENFGKTYKVKFVWDEDILGGLICLNEGLRWDASLKRKIALLEGFHETFY